MKPLGEYSISGEATELPQHPGIHIKNFGPISLPLLENQSKELMKKFKSKDTLQFEPSSIEIRNPEWQSKLQELVNRACAQLGCKGKVEAKLNKMLLSKPGGHMQKHRDSVQDQNAFATMVLQLPSVHQGAHLIIYNPDKTKTVHDFGESAKKGPYAIPSTKLPKLKVAIA